MALWTLSGGSHGGEQFDFPSDTVGTRVTLDSSDPAYTETYELRANIDAWGNPIDGFFGVYTGMAKK